MTIIEQRPLAHALTTSSLHEEKKTESKKKDILFEPYSPQDFMNFAPSTDFQWGKVTIRVINYFENRLMYVINLFRSVFKYPPLAFPLENQLQVYSSRIPEIQSQIHFINFAQTRALPAKLFTLKKLREELYEIISDLQAISSDIHLFETAPEAQKRLNTLTEQFEGLNGRLNTALSLNSRNILHQFKLLCNRLMVPGYMTERMQKDLVLLWQAVESLIPEETEKDYALTYKMEQLSQYNFHFSKGKLGEVEHPLPLQNYDSSLCYIDSVLQALFCIPEVQKKIRQKIEEKKPDVLQKKKAIQDELISFIDGPQTYCEETPDLEYSLALIDGAPSIMRLREAIFASDLHAAEFPKEALNYPAELTRQRDAASVMELMMDSMLDYKFFTQPIWASDVVKNKVFPGPAEPNFTLSIPIVKEAETLQKLVDWHFSPHLEEEKRRFELNSARTIDDISSAEELAHRHFPVIKQPEIEGAPKVKSPEISVDKYIELIQLKDPLPEILVIHLKRFDGNLTKNSSPVILPPNGILDLSDYYSPSQPGQDLTAQYELQSVVIHAYGGLNGGHYVANVKKGGHYWHCNDSSIDLYHAISEQDFYQNDQPYLLVFKRKKASSPD